MGQEAAALVLSTTSQSCPVAWNTANDSYYLPDVRGSLTSITFTLEIGCKHSTADSDPKVDLIHSSS
jgi:hypothetical protein